MGEESAKRSGAGSGEISVLVLRLRTLCGKGDRTTRCYWLRYPCKIRGEHLYVDFLTVYSYPSHRSIVLRRLLSTKFPSDTVSSISLRPASLAILISRSLISISDHEDSASCCSKTANGIRRGVDRQGNTPPCTALQPPGHACVSSGIEV